MDMGHLFHKSDLGSKILTKPLSYIECIGIKKLDKTHHEQYLLAANLLINKFLLFSNAFITNTLRTTATCITCFVDAVFALAKLSFVVFLHTAIGATGLVGVSFSFYNKPRTKLFGYTQKIPLPQDF